MIQIFVPKHLRKICPGEADMYIPDGYHPNATSLPRNRALLRDDWMRHDPLIFSLIKDLFLGGGVGIGGEITLKFPWFFISKKLCRNQTKSENLWFNGRPPCLQTSTGVFSGRGLDQLMANYWFGLAVWILKGTLRIPNHRAPNDTFTIS